MALINCPDCGREVSDQAVACPRCGYPVAAKRDAGAAPDTPAPAAAPEEQEQVIWQGSPSQLVNTKTYAFCLLAVAFIAVTPWALDHYFGGIPPQVYWVMVFALLPLAVAGWRWLQIRSHRYELTTERVRIETGVLSKTQEVIELYRIKDISLERPLIMRMCGLGSVTAYTSDRSAPMMTFYAVRQPRQLTEALRTHVEARRIKRGVRELDVD
jgi:membrane protein YdbS with pleckstrin-like domain